MKLKITITLPLSYLPNSTIQNNETKVILILVNHCMCLFGFLFVTRKSWFGYKLLENSFCPNYNLELCKQKTKHVINRSISRFKKSANTSNYEWNQICKSITQKCSVQISSIIPPKNHYSDRILWFCSRTSYELWSSSQSY